MHRKLELGSSLPALDLFASATWSSSSNESTNEKSGIVPLTAVAAYSSHWSKSSQILRTLPATASMVFQSRVPSLVHPMWEIGWVSVLREYNEKKKREKAKTILT